MSTGIQNANKTSVAVCPSSDVTALIALNRKGLTAMALRLLGHIELPEHRASGGFDHADIHHPTDRLYVAYTSNDSIDVIDCARDQYIESIHGLMAVAGPLVTRREYQDGVLATIAHKDEIARFKDERPCHCHQAGYRFNVLISRAVDHVDRVIAGMCDVEPIRGLMNVGVIEPAIGSMCREFDVAE